MAASAAGWTPRRSASPSRAAGASRHNSSEGVTSLVFGGHTVPVLNAAVANSRAGVAEMRPAAGAPISQQTNQRRSAEMNLERRQKAPARSVIEHYDAYLDACEDHTFGKLRANLARVERKAEREHNFMRDAAGMSVERRNVRADAKVDGRRDKSPARYAGRDAARMAGGDGVASLIQQPDLAEQWRPPSPRAASPRPAARANSPRRTHPSSPPPPMHMPHPADMAGRPASPGRPSTPSGVPRLPTSGVRASDAGGAPPSTERAYAAGGAYASNYASGRRAPSPRGEQQRAASPRRGRPC